MYRSSEISLLEKFLTGDGAEPIENSFTMSIFTGEDDLTVLAKGSFGYAVQIHLDTVGAAHFSQRLHFSPARVDLRKLLKKRFFPLFLRHIIDSFFCQLTVATPCTWAVVPSGNVIIGLLGSTWIKETVPSGFVIVCNTVGYCDNCYKKRAIE